MGLHLLSFISSGSMVDIDGTFFIQLALFLFMFVFLYIALFRPMVRLIEARREATLGAKEKAAKMSEEAAALTVEVEDRLAKVRLETAAHRAELIEKARTEEREMLAAARAASHEAAEEARTLLSQKQVEVKKQLAAEVEQMASTLAGRLLGRSL